MPVQLGNDVIAENVNSESLSSDSVQLIETNNIRF